MNLQQLYYFRKIAQLEHFTKAAEELRISQSSLSHAIHGLEEELNAELFSRSGRNVVLTQYGKMFLPYVEKALATLEEGSAKVRDAIDPDSGNVSIACFPSLGSFVADLIVRYISETSRVGVRVSTAQETFFPMSEDILNGKVDLTFSTWIDDPAIDGFPIGEHELVLLVSSNHRFASLDSIDLRELNGENFIAYSEDCQIRHQTDEIFSQLGIAPKITMETPQDVFIYGLVSANRGVAIAPNPLGAAPYNVKIVRIQNVTLVRTLYMLWNKNSYLSPAVKAFRDFVIRDGTVFDQFCIRNRLL